MRDLQQNMRKMREIRGMPLNSVARLAGITQGNLFRIENGENPNPTLSTLIRIANVFNVSVGNLVDGEFNPSDEDRRFLRNFHKLSDKNKLIIKQIITLMNS